MNSKRLNVKKISYKRVVSPKGQVYYYANGKAIDRSEYYKHKTPTKKQKLISVKGVLPNDYRDLVSAMIPDEEDQLDAIAILNQVKQGYDNELVNRIKNYKKGLSRPQLLALIHGNVIETLFANMGLDPAVIAQEIGEGCTTEDILNVMNWNQPKKGSERPGTIFTNPHNGKKYKFTYDYLGGSYFNEIQ